MIPHYSPPFGPARVLSAILSRALAPDVDTLERMYAEDLGVRAAVLVPAVRSAILMLLKASADAKTLVVGPAYTCLVVHEAMISSGARVRFVEPSAGGFLMTVEEVCAATEPAACLVLSEMYGLAYDERFLRATQDTRPRLRILDMAMGVPDPERLQEMQPGDVALFSFGFGKSLCAGGGGVACFQDEDLAARIRKRRTLWCLRTRAAHASATTSPFSRSVSIRTRMACRPAKVGVELWRAGRRWAAHRDAAAAHARAASRPSEPRAPYISHEWTHSMTPVERKLAAYNLGRMRASAEIRRRQSEVYVGGLRDCDVLHWIDGCSLPQSHFPIRVSAAYRERLRHYLGRRGIETGFEFPFSGALDRDRFPGAARTSDEVLTLPLGEHVSLDDVRSIARHVAAGLRDRGVTE